MCMMLGGGLPTGFGAKTWQVNTPGLEKDLESLSTGAERILRRCLHEVGRESALRRSGSHRSWASCGSTPYTPSRARWPSDGSRSESSLCTAASLTSMASIRGVGHPLTSRTPFSWASTLYNRISTPRIARLRSPRSWEAASGGRSGAGGVRRWHHDSITPCRWSTSVLLPGPKLRFSVVSLVVLQLFVVVNSVCGCYSILELRAIMYQANQQFIFLTIAQSQ